jgi:hypothetical protein
MELSFSAQAQPGGDGNCGSAISGTGLRFTRPAQTTGTQLSSKGIQIERSTSHLEMPARKQQTEWSQRVEPEKERGTFQGAQFTACQ